MIVAHHREARHVPYDVRSALSLLIQVFSTIAESKLRHVRAVEEKRVGNAQASLIDMILNRPDHDPTGSSLAQFVPTSLGCLGELIEADTVAVVDDERVVHSTNSARGREADLLKLADWILGGPLSRSEAVYETSSLSHDGYDGANSIRDIGAGVIAIRVQESVAEGLARTILLLWLKQEFKQRISWAGGIDKTHSIVGKLPNGDIGPRNSFTLVNQKLELSSLPWRKEDQKIAKNVQMILEDTASNDRAAFHRADIVHNITQSRLRSMTELSKLSSQLETTMGNLPMGILILDLKGCVERCNAWLQEKGGKSFSYRGSHISEVCSSDDLLKAVNNAFTGSESYNISFEIGESSAPVIGDVIPRIGNAATQQRRAIGVVILIQQRAKLGKDLASVLSPVFKVDKAFKICLWNSGMTRVTGIRGEEAVDRIVMGELFASENKKGILSVDTHMKFLEMEVLLMRMLDNDGKDVPEANLEISVISPKSGKALDLQLTFITSAETQEEEVHDGSVTIIVQDVSLKRAVEKAEAVKQAAEAALNSKSQTISFLCHEIRNPLNGIMASTSFMLESKESLDPLHQELVDTTDTCSKQLRRVVDDILDLSKMEVGKLMLTSDPFNLVHLVSTTLRQIVAPATQKNLRLFLDTTRTTCQHVTGDMVRTQQILTNILWNAVKYTMKGSITVTMSTVARNERVHTKIEVRDTGVGISKKDQLTVFSQFNMNTDTITKWGSSGLGLNISRMLTNRMVRQNFSDVLFLRPKLVQNLTDISPRMQRLMNLV